MINLSFLAIGWIFPRDLFETFWEDLHEVRPIFVAEESRLFTRVLSLPHWGCYRNFELLVPHTNVHEGDYAELFWSGFG